MVSNILSHSIKFLLIIFLFIITSCTDEDLYKTKSFSSNGNVNAIVEIPAGTNLKYEYDSGDKRFKPNQVNGEDRIVNYLPYPVNYGFIPSTIMDKNKGGDGDPLDVLVICPALETGTVVEVIPLALMKLFDAGEQDHKIVAIPACKDMQTVKAASYKELDSLYFGLKSIIELWFLNYKGKNITTGVEWYDEKYATEEIRKWIIP